MVTATKHGLGKGLGALISENYTQPVQTKPQAQQLQAQPVSPSGNGISTLAIGKLQAGIYQPRTRFDEISLSELTESIKQNGIMQPVIVRPAAKSSGKFEIIAGERRWRAAKMAGLHEVPCIVRELTDKQALEFALVENIQRKDLTPLEEAIGYQRLIEEFEYTQEELSSVVGKSRSHIANLLRLQALPDEVKKLLDSGELSMGHARALLTAQNPVALALQIVREGLSVRQAERYSAGAQEKKEPAQRNPFPTYNKPAINKDPDIVALEESLSENLGIRVSIQDRGQSGEIVLAYDSLSQLDEILQRLGKSI